MNSKGNRETSDQSIVIEDLPVDGAQQDEVKGGNRLSASSPYKVIVDPRPE